MTSEITGFERNGSSLTSCGRPERFSAGYDAHERADHGADSWRRVSLAYGKTKVTMPEDRAIAIEGLARRFRPDFTLLTLLAVGWSISVSKFYGRFYGRGWRSVQTTILDVHQKSTLRHIMRKRHGIAKVVCPRLSLPMFLHGHGLHVINQVTYLDQGYTTGSGYLFRAMFSKQPFFPRQYKVIISASIHHSWPRAPLSTSN